MKLDPKNGAAMLLEIGREYNTGENTIIQSMETNPALLEWALQYCALSGLTKRQMEDFSVGVALGWALAVRQYEVNELEGEPDGRAGQ